MDKKAAKQEALRRAMESLSEETSYEPVEVAVEPHEATCPNCGHTWVMGEEDDDTSES